MNKTLYESILHRLLREAYEPTDAEKEEIKHSNHVKTLMPLAVYIKEFDANEKAAILYSPQDVMKLLGNYRSEKQKYSAGGPIEHFFNKQNLTQKSVEGAVRGLVIIKRPKQPCHGAWEVTGAAGPGGADIARSVYGLAYAMAPNGIVMSDRKSVSAPAKSAWARVSSKGGRGGLALDDYTNPKTSDPNDDCRLYKGMSGRTPPEKNPQLQYAYSAQGWENAMMNYLVAAHESFSEEIDAVDPGLSDTLATYLENSIIPFFQHHYPGHDND